MLNIPDSIKNLFKADGVRKNFRAHFPNGELPDITNDNIVQESVRFAESLCSQDVFKFGLAEASMIEFETVGVANMYGMWMECSCEIDTSSLSASELASAGAEGYDGTLVLAADSDLGYGFYRVPYGVFRVESCPRDHQAKAHRVVTAYSENFSSFVRSSPNIPENLAVAELTVNPAAFWAQATLSNLDAQQVEVGKYLSPYTNAVVCRSDWYEFYYIVPVTPDAGWHPPSADTPGLYDVMSCMPTGIGIPNSDFFSARFQYDPSEYYAFGKQIADALAEAGYSLAIPYGYRGNYITSRSADNETVLQQLVPSLFFPCIFCNLNTPILTNENVNTPYEDYVWTGILNWQKVEPGKLYPIINSSDELEEYAFQAVPAFPPAGAPDNGAYYYYGLSFFPPELAGKKVTELRLYNARSADGAYHTVPLTVPITVPTMYLDESSLTSYRLKADDANTPIRVKSSKQGDGHIVTPGYPSSVAFVQNNIFSVDRNALFDGFLEMTAQFGKVNRHGGMKLTRLNKTSAITLGPNDYSNFWLDEYNVDNIGAIKYTYVNEDGEQQERIYRFGPGSSTYDMADNNAIKNLSGATPEHIESLLKESFVPYLGAINFTPIDLSMKGLPYIEDGDYLTVAAQDGSLVESFNLEHTVKGAQVLSAEVKSVSGEILESWGD